MNQLSFFFLFLFSCAISLAQNLLPIPQYIEKNNAVFFDFRNCKGIKAHDSLANETHYLKQILLHRTNLKHIPHKKQGSFLINLQIDPFLPHNEAYTLNITSTGIQITGKTKEGLFRGITTLDQLLRGDANKEKQNILSGLFIKDQPRVKIRELMIDPVRHFIPYKELKTLIPIFAKYKINTLHLHLTDDQAWRLEIKKYPKLTKQASQRIGMDDMLHPISGFYTQDEMKDLVAYAKLYHIQIIPELELPGHSQAAFSVYPYLTCSSEPVSIRTKSGVSNHLFCASKESTYTFIKDILEEIIAVFNPPYIHLGGDEAGIPPLAYWNSCPSCTAFKKTKKMQNNWELQAYLFQQIIDFLQARNITPMFWYETDFKTIPKGCVTFAWRHGLTQKAIQAAIQNQAQIILCPGEHCYLDYPEQQGDIPEVNWGMPATSLSQTYKLDPAWGNNETFVQNNLLGVAGTLWSESIPNTPRLLYMALPRAIALSEAGWSFPQNRSYIDFLLRLKAELKDLSKQNIPYNTPNY